MNFKLFITTFFTILVAEIFDKTELAIVSLSLKEEDKMSIFFGALSAFFIATIIALVLGTFISRFVSTYIMRYLSGGVFLVVGVLILLGKI